MKLRIPEKGFDFFLFFTIDTPFVYQIFSISFHLWNKNQLSFEIRSAAECPKIEKDAFCIAGEMNDESVQKKLIAAGCTDVLDIVRNASLSF